MTAVEWLEKELKDRYALMNSEPLFQQALEMEKEQIIDAINSCTDGVSSHCQDFEEWFKNL